MFVYEVVNGMAKKTGWFDAEKKRLGYKGCRNCKSQIDVFRACEWLENGGDGSFHLICPKWERKDGEEDA